MAFVMASSQQGAQMLQKGSMQPIFHRASTAFPQSSPSEMSDMSETDFEDDMSDFDDYAGRRSEESYGKRSDTTVSTYEELRTPASNEFKGFNFQLPKDEIAQSPKQFSGPTGPHLLRYSLEALQDSLDREELPKWSPIASPQRAGPAIRISLAAQSVVEEAPTSSVPLELWEPHQVAGWMRTRAYDESLIQTFRMNDISGGILKDLKYGDLQELGIKSFGLRQTLWNDIRNLRGAVSLPSTPAEECYSPAQPAPSPMQFEPSTQGRRHSPCSNPPSPDGDGSRSPAISRRRARRALRPDDIISPAESASIVAIEQLLPRPHKCSKGESCKTWRKQQRQLARIAKEFPLELEQIGEANASPTELSLRPTSEAVPSVVASSDLLGPGVPSLRLDESVLRVVPPRDPQENVRQFINFQHLDSPSLDSFNDGDSSAFYEGSPSLSLPATTQLPCSKLSSLPFKLTIPDASTHEAALSPEEHTIVRQTRTPITAMQNRGSSSIPASTYDPYSHSNGHDIFRLGSPASVMDVPVTSIPSGPIARDNSQSVPPNMRYRDHEDPISRSTSRAEHHQYYNPHDQQFSHQLFTPITRPSTAEPRSTTPLSRSTSTTSRSQQQRFRQPSFAMAPVHETHILSPMGEANEELTPTAAAAPSLNTTTNGPISVNYAGWMKKRKTKMLRHEWHENHFRLKGTKLAMHHDARTSSVLECIDVDEYAVACSSAVSNKKLTSAFKGLKLGAGKKADDVSAFSFQLVPSTMEKSGLFDAKGKTHHFAVKGRDERIDWMRELMLAKALKQRGDGCEVNVNGRNLI